MKKILSAIIILSIVLSGFSAFGMSHREEDIAQLLYELDIMKGDPDGNLRLDDSVSRAEFSKIAIAASSVRKSVAENMTVSPFKDVQYTHWAAPYVKHAVTHGYISGYPDSTFRPENPVLYEEAATITLKLLGYTEEDFGDSWPYGQTGLAKKLELNENINAGVGQNMTRRDVMHLIYNVLNTYSKGTAVNYITQLDYDIAEDVILIATALQDPSVGAGKVSTSSGVYKINSSFDYDSIGRKGDVIIKNKDELVRFIPSEQIVSTYNVYQILDNDIAVMENGRLTTVNLDKNLTVYNKTTKTTLGALMQSLNPGDTVEAYSNENGISDYGFVYTDNLEGPFTVKTAGWRSGTGISGALTVMRDGVKVSEGDVQVNDIIYYSKPLSAVWAYSKKVTGVYESASPNKDMPTTITVSGISYSLEGASSYNAVSSNGQFNYGDTVTLLLGKTGSVADVIPPTSTGSALVGYLLETGTKEFTNANGERYNSQYIKAAAPSGDTFEFACQKDYSSFIGSVVKVNVSGGNATITLPQKTNDISGKFNAVENTIGKNNVASGVQIIDVSLYGRKESGTYVKVFPQRLDGAKLTVSDIIYCEKNEKNEISAMILNDFTGDTADYGIVLSAPEWNGETSTSGTYEFDIKGTVKTQTFNALFSAYSGNAAKFSYANGGISNIRAITKLSSAVTGITPTYLEYSGGRLALSDTVVVYRKTSSTSNKALYMPLKDLMTDDFNAKYRAEAYYDKMPESGGRIRVIIVTPK